MMADDNGAYRSVLARVVVEEVQAGDRMGEGRWQGVVITQVRRCPTVDGTYHLLLGSHGEVSYKPGARLLVERREAVANGDHE